MAGALVCGVSPASVGRLTIGHQGHRSGGWTLLDEPPWVWQRWAPLAPPTEDSQAAATQIWLLIPRGELNGG